MALIFERIQTPGIAVLSYFIADDDAGVAAVVDPSLDSERYLAMAQANGVAITHVLETHIHADFVSGARRLAGLTGTAQIHASHAGGARYGFPTRPVQDGSVITIGSTRLTAKHTPGHTPEHVSYLLADEDEPEAPWAILTGDSLFVGSAGRPDLLGDEQTEELTRALHRTLYEFDLELPALLSIWAGWLLAPEEPLLLVVPRAASLSAGVAPAPGRPGSRAPDRRVLWERIPRQHRR